MNYSLRQLRPLVALVVLACATSSLGSNVIMKDGRRLHGRLGKTTGLANNPQNNQQGAPATITLVDDDLRRIFVPTFQIQAVDELNAGDIPEKVTIHQRTAVGGKHVNRVGPILKVTPFNEYGRRVFTMNTSDGPVDVIQGITLVTPHWTKVEGLLTAQLTPLVWDMRIATSSIPRDTLHKILVNAGTRNSVDARLRVVRLFLQAERYQDAQQELEGVIADFPDQKDLEKEVQSLRQLHARSIVEEIELRRNSGQHFLAYSLLQKFPSQDVAGETLAQVRELLTQYEDVRKRRDEVAAELSKLAAALPDGPDRSTCEALVKEMNAEMSLGNFDRLAGYIRLRDDKTLSDSQRLSIAISGWLLGSRFGRNEPTGHGLHGPRARAGPSLHERAGAPAAQRNRTGTSHDGRRLAAARGQADRQHEAAARYASAFGRNARLLHAQRADRHGYRARRELSRCSFRRSTILMCAIRRSSP